MNAIIFLIFVFLQESDFLLPSLVEREAHFRHPSTYFFPEYFRGISALTRAHRHKTLDCTHRPIPGKHFDLKGLKSGRNLSAIVLISSTIRPRRRNEVSLSLWVGKSVAVVGRRS